MRSVQRIDLGKRRRERAAYTKHCRAQVVQDYVRQLTRIDFLFKWEGSRTEAKSDQCEKGRRTIKWCRIMSDNNTLNTCAAFVAWTNTHVQIQSKAFFQVLRQCDEIFVFTSYDLNTLVPRTGCVSDAIILEELASRLRLTGSGQHLFCEFAPQGENTPTEYRQHIDSISTAYRKHTVFSTIFCVSPGGSGRPKK